MEIRHREFYILVKKHPEEVNHLFAEFCKGGNNDEEVIHIIEYPWHVSELSICDKIEDIRTKVGALR